MAAARSNLSPRQSLFDSYEIYHQLRKKYQITKPPLTTTAGPTTTAAIPGMEEGEYEPEEGVMPGALTTAAPPGALTTTVIVAKPPLAPLMMLEGGLSAAGGTANPLLADAGRTIPTDPLRSHGVDCYGKKGYYLQPGQACKAYVFCKPTGAIYSFTCPGDYLYNAEKGRWLKCKTLNELISKKIPQKTIFTVRASVYSWFVKSYFIPFSYHKQRFAL